MALMIMYTQERLGYFLDLGGEGGKERLVAPV